MDEPSLFAVAVKAVINEKGMSVAELARECQVDRSSLSLWLRGLRDLRVSQLERILRCTGRLGRAVKAVKP